MTEDERYIKSLTRVTREDRKKIEVIYISMFNKESKTCYTCPSSVRQTVNKIKNGFRDIREVKR